MDLGAIALQLRNHAPLFSGRVAGAGDLATAEDHALRASLPAAFVVPLTETATGNENDAGLQQQVEYRFAVLACVSAAKHEDLGKAGWDQVATCRRAILAAILNWTPPDAAEPITYNGGGLHALSRAFMGYRFEFNVTFPITEDDGFQPADLPAFELAHVDWLLKPGDQEVDAQDDVTIPQP